MVFFYFSRDQCPDNELKNVNEYSPFRLIVYSVFLTLYRLSAFNSAYGYKIITEVVFIHFMIKNCTICYTGQSDENKDYVFNDQNKFNLLKDLKLLIISDFFK